MTVLYLVGFFQALFFIILILTKKQHSKSDYLLSFFLLLLGMRLLFFYSSDTDFYSKYPLLIIPEILYWTLLGPTLYIYIDVVVSENEHFKINYLSHLIPTLIVFAGLSEYFFSPEMGSLHEFKSDSLFFIFSQYVWLLNTHVYYIFCIIRLRKHKKRIQNYYSFTKDVDLKWLNYLTHGFAVFLFYFLFYILLRKFAHFELPFVNSNVSWTIIVLYIFGIGFYGFKKRVNIFSDYQNDFEEINARTYKKRSLYKKSGLQENEKKDIIKQLGKYMSEQKPYLNPELNIRQLAESLEIPAHKLSQTINQSLQKSFLEFINEYRVKDAINYLVKKEYENLTIIAIAIESGFNSKTSFYNTFKKHTSKTPSEYRQSFINSN